MDSELVNQIVRQVVAAMGAGGSGRADISSLSAVKAAPAGGAVRRVGPAKSDARPVARVFITAEMLAQRFAAGDNGGGVELAGNEFLTPAASDLADEKHIVIRRAPIVSAPKAPVTASKAADPASPAPAGARTNSRRGSIGLVTDRADAKVDSLIAALGYDGLSILDYGHRDCWIVNLHALCDAVIGGAVTAGIVVLPYAADAIVVANKIAGIRAVQATRPASVEAAIRRFNANLMIVEHAFSTYHEMRAMVRLFVAERGRQPTAEVFMDALDQIERT